MYQDQEHWWYSELLIYVHWNAARDSKISKDSMSILYLKNVAMRLRLVSPYFVGG
jgi:hypothetical protein